MDKVLEIQNCSQCFLCVPLTTYGGNARFTCRDVGKDILRDFAFPDWCPLAEAGEAVEDKEE